MQRAEDLGAVIGPGRLRNSSKGEADAEAVHHGLAGVVREELQVNCSRDDADVDQDPHLGRRAFLGPLLLAVFAGGGWEGAKADEQRPLEVQSHMPPRDGAAESLEGKVCHDGRGERLAFELPTCDAVLDDCAHDALALVDPKSASEPGEADP